MEALLVWQEVWDLHRPQEFEVLLYSQGVEHEVEEVVRANQGLWLWDQLSSGKANIVADILSKKSMVELAAC